MDRGAFSNQRQAGSPSETTKENTMGCCKTLWPLPDPGSPLQQLKSQLKAEVLPVRNT